MTLDAAIALAVLVVTGIVLVLDRFQPVVVLGGAVLALLFAGVVDSRTALSGLSSTAPATIAALYVVAAAATATGAVAALVDRVLGRSGSVWSLSVVTATCSAVMPNTPLVAVIAPRIVRWSQERGADASRLLMPLSFASILGGVVTLMGTSTNLVVSDLLEQSGAEPLGVFEISAVGAPVAAVGVIVLSTVGVRLLPKREAATSVDGWRDFQMSVRVDPEGPLVGRTLVESGLRSLDGAFLATVERRDRDGVMISSAATPHTVLEADDICCFVGDAQRMLDLHDTSGLAAVEEHQASHASAAGTSVYEAVVAPGSSLVGSSLRAADFRSRFGGAVMAIHRADTALQGQLGRIPLRGGDVLLVVADEAFTSRWRSDADFSLVAQLDGTSVTQRTRAPLVLLAIAVLIVAAGAGVLPLFEASVAAALIVIAGGVLTMRDAWRGVNLDVVMTMAVAISLGAAVAESGLAGDVASLVERVDSIGLGTTAIIVAIMVVTIVLTELLTNTAAAALMVPVALSIAADLGVEPRAAAIAVLIGASCSFLSPVGYQTNLMVFGLGGYRFSDFTRVGAPLTVSTIVVAGILIPRVFG
ncbi:MAG: SLC13 family permease [Ilumatobacter sp.]|uniref:SLC13 family permease n=1 Tax=Ilumatobacter sp. TaxID=1967498 RepID=UPI003C76BDD3